MAVPKSAIINSEQLVTICSNGAQFLAGKKQDQVEMIQRKNGVGVSMVFDSNGRIMNVNYDDQVKDWIGSEYGLDCWRKMNLIDAAGCSVIPGLIDAHNHPIWAGDRIDEFDRKLRGATYMDIHNSGGGINYTVKQTRQTSEEELLKCFLKRINLMQRCGTTILECKTGYGLEYETEKKMLRVIEQARLLTSVELVPTFLGAHSIPEGMTAKQGVEHVSDMMAKLAKNDPNLKMEFIDLFCEKGVYEHADSEQILQRARKLFPNSKIAFHGDELSDQNSGCLAARIGARSVSHLEYLNQNGIEAMSKEKIAAIINPTTCYLLNLPKPPVRKMIESEVPVVVATDYNPNATCYSLPMAMNIAAVYLGMSLNECLVATTLNAAYALNRSDKCGSLEIGKKGNCLILNSADWRHLIGQFGDTCSIIRDVIIEGRRVVGE